MRTPLKSIARAALTSTLLAATFGLALAFTFGCTTDKGEGGDKGNDIKNYKTLKIGEQTWMAENLNYRGTEPDTLGKCYDNDPANCGKYGRLYTWYEANTICPSGWHLPSEKEWEALATYIQSDKGCTNCAGKHLKAKSGWEEDIEGNLGNGLDSYDFSALPGGHGSSDGIFGFSSGGSVGYVGIWWSASEGNGNNAYYRNIFNYYYESDYRASTDKSILFSVRCLQDGQDKPISNNPVGARRALPFQEPRPQTNTETKQ